MLKLQQNNITKCPKLLRTSAPKTTKTKRGRKRKATEEEQEIATKIEKNERLVQAWEAELMEDVLMNENPTPPTPRRSQRLTQGTQNTGENTGTADNTMFVNIVCQLYYVFIHCKFYIIITMIINVCKCLHLV